MGMSADYVAAIEAGANIVRVGSAYLGARSIQQRISVYNEALLMVIHHFTIQGGKNHVGFVRKFKMWNPQRTSTMSTKKSDDDDDVIVGIKGQSRLS